MTSAMPTGARASEPAKITSSMPLPRRRRGACSPIAQRIASTTFDLPQPLGPTIAGDAGLEGEARLVDEALEAVDLERLDPQPNLPARACPRRVTQHRRLAREVMVTVVSRRGFLGVGRF